MNAIKKTTIVTSMLSFALLVKCFVNIATLNNSYNIVTADGGQFTTLLAFLVFIVLLALILLPIIIKASRLSKSEEVNYSKVACVGLIAVGIAIIEVILLFLINESSILMFLVNNLEIDVLRAQLMAESYRILREHFIFINIITLIDGIITVSVAIYKNRVK